MLIPESFDLWINSGPKIAPNLVSLYVNANITKVSYEQKPNWHYSSSFFSPSIIFLKGFTRLFFLPDYFFWLRSKQYKKCRYSWLFKKEIWKLIKQQQINYQIID